MATKTISAYRGYTAAAIKARADIPNQGDMTVSGSDVLCADVNTTKIRNAIGAAINTVGGLNQHANVNEWSGFGPTVRSIAAQVLVNSDGAAPHAEGEFAGYNHGAVTPGWKPNHPVTSDLWVDNGGDAEFLVDITVGEVKWHEVANGIVGVVFALYDGGALVAYVARNFNDESVTDDCTGLYAYVENCALEKTYTGKIWLVDSTDFGPEGFDGSQIVCRLPNTNDFTRTVKIKAASSVIFDSTGTDEAPSPWVNSNPPPAKAIAMNWGTGYVSIPFSIVAPTNSWSNVRVYAVLRNWLDEVVGQADIWNGPYSAMDDLYGTADLGMINIPNYGYSVRVYFEYTT